MKLVNIYCLMLSASLLGFSSLACGDEIQSKTTCVPQFETEEVEVWKTIVLPKQPLKMHRHDKKRIVVALTDTELKVVNEKGESHIHKWKKGTAHMLEADKPGELHSDLNESNSPMEVMVIQFKK